MNRSWVLFLGLWALWAAPVAQAETLRQGGHYAAGSTVEVTKYGASFTIPSQWRGVGQSSDMIMLLPSRGESVQFMQFFASQNIFEFDRKLQRNAVLVNDHNTFVQVSAYSGPVEKGYASYRIQGQSKGKPLAGSYVAGDLGPFMSYTRLLVMPAYEWQLWNGNAGPQLHTIIEQSFAIENALIAQAKQRKQAKTLAARQAERAKKSSASRASSSSSTGRSSEHFSDGPDGQGYIGTSSDGCQILSFPGMPSFNSCD